MYWSCVKNRPSNFWIIPRVLYQTVGSRDTSLRVCSHVRQPGQKIWDQIAHGNRTQNPHGRAKIWLGLASFQCGLSVPWLSYTFLTKFPRKQRQEFTGPFFVFRAAVLKTASENSTASILTCGMSIPKNGRQKTGGIGAELDADLTRNPRLFRADKLPCEPCLRVCSDACFFSVEIQCGNRFGKCGF